MYRVFLVEDSAPILERVVQMLGSIDGVAAVGSASTALDAERQILALQPNAVLLDIQLAQGSGFDLLRSLHKRAPHIELYMLSNFSVQAYRDRAARLGASGFFDKTTEIERLRTTIGARAAQFTH